MIISVFFQQSHFFLDFQENLVPRAGVPAGRAVFNGFGELHEPRHRIIEELLVAFAEIVFSILTIEPHAIFHTAAPADVEVPANQTCVAELFFVPCECPFFSIGREFLDRRFEDIAQSSFRLDKKFATAGVAGMLDHDEAGASFATGANCVFA